MNTEDRLRLRLFSIEISRAVLGMKMAGCLCDSCGKVLRKGEPVYEPKNNVGGPLTWTCARCARESCPSCNPKENRS